MVREHTAQLHYFACGDWDWTVHFLPCLGFFQIGRGSGGFNPLGQSSPASHPMVLFGKISRG
jgi:hypothetical protein